MKFAGFQKLTLLDYPGKTACTAFVSRCNFRCPFCHNSELAFSACDRGQEFSDDEIIEYLIGRRGKIDGICISGGEPLLHSGTLEFAARVHELGFLVKIDTNGSVFDRLEYIIKKRLCDYVAMDIKNTPEKYPLSCGCEVDVDSIKKSVELLKRGLVDYEFRTTVVKELNAKEDFEQIAHWLSGAKRYYLQKFRDSECVPNHDFTAYTDEEMRDIMALVKNAGLDCGLRGVD